ncbi:hypothetical protein TcWFU_003341 [Taenia crassiceps]|uniref:Uncharacterized protein n=1 Tax=Taenia crassiceps TaxID=6207 RepID=A0ABR4QGL0_9CEST
MALNQMQSCLSKSLQSKNHPVSHCKKQADQIERDAKVFSAPPDGAQPFNESVVTPSNQVTQCMKRQTPNTENTSRISTQCQWSIIRGMQPSQRYTIGHKSTLFSAM